VIWSQAERNLGRLSSTITGLVVITVSYAIPTLLSSGVVTRASKTQVVRLSGMTGIEIFVFHFSSVVKSESQNAVSLKFHLNFFVSHHFTHSQAHHFSPPVTSFTSNFSTKYFRFE
jgi:hypothetical protein